MEKKISIIKDKLSVTRKKPIDLIETQTNIISSLDQIFNQVELYTYANVNVTPEGNVFKRFNIEEDLFIYPIHKKRYNRLHLLSTYIKRKRVPLNQNQTYLLCFDPWSNSIFHWMCDALPRIEAIKEQTHNYVLLLPNFFKYEYITETLKAYNFKSIYLFDDNQYLFCDKLVTPKQIATSGKIRPDVFKELRKTLLNYFQPTESQKLKNIYISRAKAKYRKVLNEEEIIPMLAKYNYEIVFFEDLKVNEQIEISYNAKNYISIHGANLTNLVFMRPGNNVLEFRKRGDNENNYFYELTDSVECNYYYLDCDFIDPIKNQNFFSLTVSLDSLELILKELER